MIQLINKYETAFAAAGRADPTNWAKVDELNNKLDGARKALAEALDQDFPTAITILYRGKSYTAVNLMQVNPDGADLAEGDKIINYDEEPPAPLHWYRHQGEWRADRSWADCSWHATINTKFWGIWFRSDARQVTGGKRLKTLAETKTDVERRMHLLQEALKGDDPC